MEFKTSSNLIDYQESLNFMEARVNEIILEKADELVWFLEHQALISAGSSAKAIDLLDNDALPVYQSGRGGGYTYHGPGQVVAYLMLNLKKRAGNNNPDIKEYVYKLEQIIINALAILGLQGYRITSKVGIWVMYDNMPHKIAAIGIRLRKWVAYHGIAINLAPDLKNFSYIVPCGIKQYGVISLQKLGINCTRREFESILRLEIIKTFTFG